MNSHPIAVKLPCDLSWTSETLRGPSATALYKGQEYFVVWFLKHQDAVEYQTKCPYKTYKWEDLLEDVPT